MEKDEIERHAQRLVRYAQGITSAIGGLSALLFMEEVEHSATWYELVNRFAAEKFAPLRDQRRFPGDYPLVRHGLTQWVLRPRQADDLNTIDTLAFHVVSRCCSFETIAIRRSVKHDRVKYRFLIVAGTHAHCGVITMAGDAVARLLAEARREAGGRAH